MGNWPDVNLRLRALCPVWPAHHLVTHRTPGGPGAPTSHRGRTKTCHWGRWREHQPRPPTSPYPQPAPPPPPAFLHVPNRPSEHTVASASGREAFVLPTAGLSLQPRSPSKRLSAPLCPAGCCPPWGSPALPGWVTLHATRRLFLTPLCSGHRACPPHMGTGRGQGVISVQRSKACGTTCLSLSSACAPC